jgi:hypothetical protein
MVLPLLMKFIAALIALLVIAPAAEARKAPPRYMGMNWDGAIASAPAAVRDAQFPRMATAGVETVRTTFRWADAQPVEGGPIDLSATDALVMQAAARRIDTLPIVITAPDWARISPAPLAPPRDGTLIQPYIRALIARYGPSGSLWAAHPELPRVPIRYWQFWNEPHLPYQWDLPRDRADEWPQTYTSQLKVFHSTVKQADPGAKVVLGGLANFSWRYLAALYRSGARGSFDVAALHPYTTKPKGVVRLLARFRAVMKKRGDGRKPVWVTELGLPASRGRAHSTSPLQTTPRGMARYLSGSYEVLRKRVPRVYWYTWASEYTGDIFRFAGLFRYAGTGQPATEPAYSAYVRTARRMEGCAKTAAGACR